MSRWSLEEGNMVTPKQEEILGFLKQVDAGRWEKTDEVPEGGLLTGLIESVNRGPAPTPVPCTLDDLTLLRDAHHVVEGDAPGTFILSGEETAE
jgi:hypothetical protein